MAAKVRVVAAKRQAMIVVATFVCLAMALSACGTTTGPNSQAESEVNLRTLPESSTVYRVGTNPWSAPISLNPYSPGALTLSDFALLNLAVLDPVPRPGRNPYYPELATSWDLGPSSVVIHLRRTARWQNNAPLTSADVVTSLLLAGADYNSLWASIRSVTAPNPHELRIGLQPWAVAKNVLLDLIQVPILPKSEYGSLVPAGLQQELVAYWHDYDILHPTQTSIKRASNSKAAHTISAAQKKLIKFSPSTLVGDGPYRLVKATASGIIFEKWSKWWDARAIRAPWVEVLPMTAAARYGALLSGRIDEAMAVTFTDPQVTKLEHDGGHYTYTQAAVQQESLVFSLRDYPFGILQVRQALAYLIDRKKLTQLDMGGTFIQDPATTYPDGINDFLARQYVTKAQFARMHSYNYDPSKAATLLKSVGFVRKGDAWYTPEGKPFKVTIDEPAGMSQFDQDGVVIANDLDRFGIAASTDDVEPTTYQSQVLAGDYPISEENMDWEQGPPMADFASTFAEPSAPAWNYPVSYSGSGSCDCAIGIGPTSKVPGLGTVNIAAELNREVNTAKPSSWARYTYDWARWVNDNLPILPLYNNAIHGAYDTARYTDFPPSRDKWLLVSAALEGAAQPVLWQQLGYLKLKSH